MNCQKRYGGYDHSHCSELDYANADAAFSTGSFHEDAGNHHCNENKRHDADKSDI